MLMQLPGRSAIAAGTPINISLDVAALVAAEKSRLETNLANGNLTEIIARYPVPETSALSEIARKLGFQNRDQYEDAFRKLLMDFQEALNVVKSFLELCQATSRRPKFAKSYSQKCNLGSVNDSSRSSSGAYLIPTNPCTDWISFSES